MKGVLSKKQRERKQRRNQLSQIIGERVNDWRSFVKKDNDKTMSEEFRDRVEGEKMLDQMDREAGLKVERDHD